MRLCSPPSGRRFTAAHAAAFMVAIALIGGPLPARADGQLAADKGCLGCHSNRTPKKNVATFAQLAERYAPLKAQPDALRDRAEKLRTGAIADHVNAHERLSAEESARLVQWLADGAP
jgi:cytochrome c